MNSDKSTNTLFDRLCNGLNLTSEDLSIINENAEMFPDLMKILAYFMYFEQNKERINWRKFFANVEIVMASENQDERDAIGFWVLESLPSPDINEGPLTFDFFKDLLGPQSMEYYLAYNKMMDKLPEFFKNLNSKK